MGELIRKESLDCFSFGYFDHRAVKVPDVKTQSKSTKLTKGAFQA